MQPTLEQLKIAAYDTIVAIEKHQNILREINKMIAEYTEPKTNGKDAGKQETKEPTTDKKSDKKK